MDSTPPKFWPPGLCRAVAGLDAGTFGGFLALVWLCHSSWVRGDYWWSKLNVAGSFFYGEWAFRSGFGRATVAGAALLLLSYALLGAFLGWLTPPPPRWYRSVVVGILGALLFQLVADRWLWARFHPFAAIYFPPSATLPANLFFGLSMIRLGHRNLAVLRAFGGWQPPAPLPPPAPPPAAAEPEPPPIESELSSTVAAIPPQSAPPDC
jgi:hypothetical protein